MELLERRLVDDHDGGAGGVARASPREHIGLVEDLQCRDDRHDAGDEHRRADEGQRDAGELAPAARPVDVGGLVDVLGYRGQAADEQQEGEAEVLPDVDEHGDAHGARRRREPAHRAQPDEAEDRVDGAEVLVEQIAHDEGDRGGGQDEREEEGRPEEGAQPARHPRLHEHGEDERHEDLQGDGDDDETEGVEEGHPDRRVRRHGREVVETDELRGRDDVPVEEGEEDRGRHGEEGEEPDPDHGGSEEAGGEPALPAAGGGACAGGDVGHDHSRASASSRSRCRLLSAVRTFSREPVTALRTFLRRAVSTAASCGGAGMGAVVGNRSSVS